MSRKFMYCLLATAVLAGGCTLWQKDETGYDSPSLGEIALFQKVFMSSYFAERGGMPQGSASRATVPAHLSGRLASYSFAALTAGTNAVSGNYPEPGQTTSFTLVAVSGTPPGTAVYDVTATTSFPSGDLRASYVEEYYVQDLGLNGGVNDGLHPDGTWTAADPIVRRSGGAWVLGANNWLTQDQASRIRQILTFRDGTTREEAIVSSSGAGGIKIDPAALSISGSLDLSQAFVPAPTTNANVMYSSVIMYYVTPKSYPNFWFWKGSNAQTILGVRYYTEAVDPGAASTYTAYTASFEKTVSEIATTGGDFAGTVAGILVGSTHEALAESVLRQQVVYALAGASPSDYAPTGAGAMTTKMKTRVVNIAGLKDFYLSQIDSEAATLTLGDTTIFKPSGAAEEVLAGDPSTFAFLRTQQTSPAPGILPFAVSTVDSVGLGALATIYAGITEQTATITAPTAPASNLLANATVVAIFNGQQAMGTILDPAATAITNTMGSKGAVEAWIYMETITNTAGIVHKGTFADFSDECFSLQGWGNKGQIAIILDLPDSGNSYDGVYSKANLKAKTWYHVVASWDASLGNSSYIRLYVNGDKSKLGASDKPSVSLYRENDHSVIVGSQLPTSYSASSGYFGFDGKIVGANVYATPLTDAQVAANYAANKGKTGGW
jgi:hypothetical protein